MRKIIITKLNGKNKKVEIDNYTTNKYSLDRTTINILEITDTKNKNSIITTNNFIRDIFKKYQYDIDYDSIFNKINSDKVNIETLNIYKNIIKNLDIIIEQYPKNRQEIIKESLIKTYNENPEYIIKIIIKEFINNYCKNVIFKDSDEKLKKGYLMIISNEEPNKILEELDININNKYNDLIAKTIIKKIKKTHEDNYPHLCWEYCSNLVYCDKIQDRLKKTITKYNFITDGYHMIDVNYNENGKRILKTDCFYVISCKNYVPHKNINIEKRKRKTRTIE